MQTYGSSWLQQKLRTHFFPMVADRYGPTLTLWPLPYDPHTLTQPQP